MKKLNQKGMGVVEIILVVVVVGLLGAVGIYVSHQSKDETSTTSSQPATTAATPEAYKRTTTVPKDWKTYTNKEYKITLAYPADWTVSGSTFNKKAGVDDQNVYSVNATKIFVICFKGTDTPSQMCPTQININNQSYAQSLTQLRKYYVSQADNTTYKETKVSIDGHEAVEFHSEAKGGYPGQKEYLVNANGFSYGLNTVYEGEPKKGSIQELSAKDSLILFESIKID